MPLPHYNNLDITGAPGGPGTTPQEPVFLNLFEIGFVLPTILQNQGRSTFLLLEQATNVTLNLSPEIAQASQLLQTSQTSQPLQNLSCTSPDNKNNSR